MNRTSARRRRKRSHAPKAPAIQPIKDRTVYWGLAVVGLFIGLLSWLFTDARYWGVVVLVYVIVVAYFINLYAFRAYRGQHLDHWQQCLARVPLRFVGYGSKEGKPLEAAHDHPETRTALIASLFASLAILAGLGFIVFRWTV